MKRSLLPYRFLLLVSCCFFSLLGQPSEIKFRQISPPGGFTLDGIHTILQDDLGYMWMLTREGILKYDSKNVQWIALGKQDSIFSEKLDINDIVFDKQGAIWVASSDGLFLYNDQKGSVEKIIYTYENEVSAEGSISALLKYDDNTLLVANESYFGYLNLTTKVMHRIGVGYVNSPFTLYKDGFNRFWIGAVSGDVFRYNPTEQSVVKVISNSSQISSIFSDGDEIWIGTVGGGAKLYRNDGTLIKQYKFKSETSNSDCGNVRIITKDTYGRTWFGTYEGLFMDDGNQLLPFSLDDYPNLPHSSIYEIFEDSEGGLWIGTWAGGVALLHHSDNNFKTFRHKGDLNSLSSNMVSSFCQINEDEVLVGTELGGLNRFNVNSGTFEKVSLVEGSNVFNIKSLCKDGYGGIWIGTFRKGLWYLPANAKRYIHYSKGPEDGAHISSSSVYALCSTDSGVWIGTFDRGLNFYDFKSKSIRYSYSWQSNSPLTKGLFIRSLLVDSQSRLWVGTPDNGLFRLGADASYLENINACKSRAVYYLWEHSSGDVWIGTKDKGILIYNQSNDSFEPFDASGELLGASVYGIVEDVNKDIWITTNKGLVYYNPKTFQSRRFAYVDGIQGDRFCPGALLKDSQDQLYFGGTNGFTQLHPDRIQMNNNFPYTIINDLVINNRRQIKPSYSEVLMFEKVALKSDERSLRINFSADNYLMPEKNRYKYRLLNYSDEWISNGNEGTVMFANLKAGKYVFEVKACNNDGVWNDTPTRIAIEVEEYWYLTTMALFAFFLLLVAIVYFVLNFYHEQQALRNKVRVEVRQRENEQDIHEMKLKFFTNISHDFRTPLTLISWPLSNLLRASNITKEQRDDLEVVNRNSTRLLQLVNQIIDLRKLDKGQSKLNISSIDLISFISEMQQGFKGEGKLKDIEFLVDSPFSELRIEADREKLDAILYNILSNAYKYVLDHGRIKISVNKNYRVESKSYNNQLSFGEMVCDEFVEIAIEDNGIGIDSEGFMNIFNRFEQGKGAQVQDEVSKKGSGIGLSICRDFTLLHNGEILAQSGSGKGSRFTILLPVRQKAQEVMFESHQTLKNLKTPSIVLDDSSCRKIDNEASHLLVVEDNTDLRKFICTFLNQHYQVTCAANGKEALAVLNDADIDLILSDVMMPEMDGLEFCSIVKTQVKTSHIPVVLLTALSSSDGLMAGLDNGVDAYLTKPLDQEVLLKQIDNLLAQRYRLRETFKTQFVSKKTMEVSPLDNFFLNKVRAVVEKNIHNDNFGMSLLADELLISRSQLHRKIKSLSGMSTTEFVNLVRIKKAVELIKEKDYAFSEVAFEVGFSSQAYFTKCFKKVFDTTPKAYFSELKKSSDLS